jgi:divalent metal cation (Fe/Co/Zn/Cd) transporter
VLAAVAVFLSREAKGLLIGESADDEHVRHIWRLLDQRPEITHVNHVRTIHSAPESVFVAVSADFEDSLTLGEGERIIEDIETELKSVLPQLSSIYIRPEKKAEAVVVERGEELASPPPR